MWDVVFLNEKVEEEFDSFSIAIQAKISRVIMLIKSQGVFALTTRYAKYIDQRQSTGQCRSTCC